MFEVNVTVNAPALTEALNNLAAAISGKSVTVPTAPVSPVAQANNTPAANPTTPAVAPVPAQGAVPTQAVNTGAPVNTAPSVPSAPSPSNAAAVPTIDALSKAGAALCEQGKMQPLIDLLGKYGVVAVTQLNGATPDVLNAFANDMRALGANI